MDEVVIMLLAIILAFICLIIGDVSGKQDNRASITQGCKDYGVFRGRDGTIYECKPKSVSQSNYKETSA